MDEPAPNDNSKSKLEQVRDSLKNLNAKNSVDREFELNQIANLHHLPLESVRQMYKDYCREQIEEQWRDCKWRSPLWKCERVLEWLNCTFSQTNLFQVLEYVSKLSILVGVIAFGIDSCKRGEQRVVEQKRANYEAWRIITNSEDKPSNAGRIDALQDLNNSKVSLVGVNVAKAHLSGVKLPGSRLDQANFRQANLVKADLSKAILTRTNFQGANLSDANLQGASMYGTNLRDAYLEGTKLKGAALTSTNLMGSNLEKAKLNGVKLKEVVYDDKTRFPSDFDRRQHKLYLIKSGVQLRKANLVAADLSSVNLSKADLREADLREANLTGANLTQVNLSKADLERTNFRKVIGITPKQIQEAKNWQEAIYDDAFRKRLGS